MPRVLTQNPPVVAGYPSEIAAGFNRNLHPSGSVSDNGVRPMLTFRDAAGRPCREFEVVNAQPQELELGIACRIADGDWHIDILVATPAAADTPETGFAPAAGVAGDALRAMLDAMGAGPPLAPQEEDRLLDEGRRP